MQTRCVHSSKTWQRSLGCTISSWTAHDTKFFVSTDDFVDIVVNDGAIEAVVPLLSLSWERTDDPATRYGAGKTLPRYLGLRNLVHLFSL